MERKHRHFVIITFSLLHLEKFCLKKKISLHSSWIVLYLSSIALHKWSLAQLLILFPCKAFWNRLSMLFSTQLSFRILLEYLFKLYLHHPTSFSIQSSKASYIPPKPTWLSFSWQQSHIFWYQFLYVSSLLLWWTVWPKVTYGESSLFWLMVLERESITAWVALGSH